MVKPVGGEVAADAKYSAMQNTAQKNIHDNKKYLFMQNTAQYKIQLMQNTISAEFYNSPWRRFRHAQLKTWPAQTSL